MTGEHHREPDVTVLPWEDHLDALEEWLRRAQAALEAGEELPAPTSTPEGPLPEHLRLRAAVAVQAMEQLEQAGARRVRELQRGQAYTRW